MTDGTSINNAIAVFLALVVTAVIGCRAQLFKNDKYSIQKKNKTYLLFVQVMGTKELSSHIFSYCSYSFIEIAMTSKCNKLCNSLVSTGTMFTPFLTIKRLVNVKHLLWITHRAKSIHSIDFSIIPSTDDVLLEVAKCCNVLRHAIFAQNKIITDVGLLNLVSHCTQIEVLMLPGTNITDHALSCCRIFLRNLRYLDVSNCDNICNEGLVELFEECKLLEFVDLSSTKVTDGTIGALMQSCLQIKQIILFKCFLLTDEACVFMSRAPTAANITHISLSKCYGLSDASLTVLAKSLKSLTYLDISHVETITDRTLIAIAENAKDIALINTSWCKLVTDVGINALAAECPNLKELHIRECYRVSDEAIASMKTNKCTVFDY